MLTARIFATSHHWSSTFPVAPYDCLGNAGEEAAAQIKTGLSKWRHLVTSTIFVLLLLSGVPSVLVFGQTDSQVRPRRIQSPSSLPEENDPTPPFPEAKAVAKRLYQARVQHGLAC